ncbi:MAG: elongation factor 4 [Parcubacteria group bacterium CG1_02_37_51]|uniref:Elongation factor 4 n=2 Tax=Candidatus Komeiliibacteriota TaxID=1817908 RepID=A0A2M7RDW4_9BACT|nr:MAG: elongation factor 4 [Parcubacteria group bacterium CG1_02_37_51]PIY94751.1 MAG: elongation factor 4 [Candidatus Komeilibacteria bacterium CG_4_10_14_0_8_um_filter_37_78]
MEQSRIRNFSIIAHIDHGKSTLADRFLELTNTVAARDMKQQVLDSMDIERERGITIKLQSVRMSYQDYELNLIDTPGHVDFNYEVSRSLAAVEGAILVVDATQGIQAQTLANLYLALEQDLMIIPVLNKIDLPAADVPAVTAEIVSLLGCQASDVIVLSAKTGNNVEAALQAVIKNVPPPRGDINQPTQAMIFDSNFDDYKGVITYVRVINGNIAKGDKIKFIGTQAQSEVLEIGYFAPQLKITDHLGVGEIGYLITGVKEIALTRVGDTITQQKNPGVALPGYKKIQSMVYAGIYCQEGHDYPKLRAAIEKLKLNDSALDYQAENSPALGFGFRCGFLGLLHLEVFQERLRREFNLELVITVPAVAYRVTFTNGEVEVLNNPQDFGDMTRIKKIEEPILRADIIVPQTYLGNIMQLLQDRRAEYINTEYLDAKRVILHYSLPLSAILTDFYGQLKSQSSGYASLNYIFDKYQEVRVVKLDILIAEEKVDSLSMMIYEDDAYNIGRRTVAKLKDILPRQQWVVKIQAAIGGKIIAAEKLSALRKDVTAKLYGGDVTRKRKLLDKQKKGKKKMAGLGKIKIPSEAYLAILKKDD